MIFKKKPEELFTNLPIETANWIVVSWNHGELMPQERTFLLELHHLGKYQLKFSKLNQRIEVNSLNKKQILSFDQKNRDLLNLSLHGALVSAIEKGKKWAINESNTIEQSQLMAEERAKEWIRVSFKVLTNALLEIKKKKELILQATLMCGIFPENGQRLIRLHIFNLDIYYHFLQDESLRVVIFDQNDQKLDQRIWVTKPQIYDELIKLMIELGKAGEIEE